METGAISTELPAKHSRGPEAPTSKRRKGRCWWAFAIRRRSLNSQVGEPSVKVFGDRCEYSRSWATCAGDEVRSPLRTRACSVTCPIPILGRRQIVKLVSAAARRPQCPSRRCEFGSTLRIPRSASLPRAAHCHQAARTWRLPVAVELGETPSLTSTQLSSLIGGLDWRAPEQRWRPAVAG